LNEIITETKAIFNSVLLWKTEGAANKTFENMHTQECTYSRYFVLKELRYGILSYFFLVQNYLEIEGNLKIIVY